MSLDKIFERFLPHNPVLDSPISLDFIRSDQTIFYDSHEICFVFPPWGWNVKLAFGLKNQFKRKNISYVTYQFDESILSTDLELTVIAFDLIQRQFNRDVSLLGGNFEEIGVLGFSLGCVSAIRAANLSKRKN